MNQQPEGARAPAGARPGAPPLPALPVLPPRSSPLLIFFDWVLMLVAMVVAIALAWGARHPAWQVLAGVVVSLLAFQILRKLVRLHRDAMVKEFPPGVRRLEAGTPSGRRLPRKPD
jgi:hypothetical protein